LCVLRQGGTFEALRRLQKYAVLQRCVPNVRLAVPRLRMQVSVNRLVLHPLFVFVSLYMS
jgi:hypothetical protein